MNENSDSAKVPEEARTGARVEGDQTAAQVQMTGGDGDADKARADYEAALKKRDDKIVELEGEIAEAVKAAERRTSSAPRWTSCAARARSSASGSSCRWRGAAA